jgi:hypothetical protein
MMPKFNLNNNVFVKLNDKGRAMHKAYWEPFSSGNYRAPMESYDGWSQFQLHEVMSVFGPAMSVGMDNPMETEIILDCDRPMIPQRIQGESSDG